jgi:branched-chain amino acid transport system permease protein
VSFVVVQFLTGLASAASLFLVASGLSLIFGVSRIVNFAHGSLYMLGAYLAFTTVQAVGGSLAGFAAAVAIAGLAVGLIGVAIETGLLRRLYRSPELLQLVATFAVVLILEDVTLALWGPHNLMAPRIAFLNSPVQVLGHRLPAYDLVLIALGPLVLAVLVFILHRTRWGTLIRAAAEDREMVAVLGVNEKHLFTSVFFFGALLAGIGGALQLPREPANLMMDLGMIAEAFVVVVVGGMGSVGGAFLAAVLISQIHAFGILVFPEITLVVVFLVMAVVLIVRPWGLLGRAETAQVAETHAIAASIPPGRASRRLALVLMVSMALVPAVVGDYGIRVATEIAVFALFAASLQFLMGVGGVASFGHAAYLGVGAYAAALAATEAGLPMVLALTAAPIAAAAAAVLFGWFSVRLSGVYLAMLSLAFAQITWSFAFQSYDLTGGDNGILGVWPSRWAADPHAYYYLTLAVVTVATLILARITASPFGLSLRAGWDSMVRSEAIGIDVRGHRWAAFVIAGLFAGLSGGLYAFLKGSVFPDALGIPISVDALVMVLLGGIGSLTGALLGAGVFTLLKIVIASETDYWRAVLGIVIIALIMVFPNGIVGTLATWIRRKAP